MFCYVWLQALKSPISQEEEDPQESEKLSGQLIKIKSKLAALKSHERESQLKKIFQILDGSAMVIDIKQPSKKRGAPKFENVANQNKGKPNDPILSILKRKPKQVKTANLIPNTFQTLNSRKLCTLLVPFQLP
jgi:hypothetical protein